MEMLAELSCDAIDYLIIGGGAAGCVLASRLSERPDLHVLLMERGAVFEANAEPPAISDFTVRSMFNPLFMWSGLTAIIKRDPQAIAHHSSIPYLAARALGGGSSVNGMLAHRGLPGDYDEWKKFGVSCWDWEDVLPFFRKLETDLDFDAPFHGASGPLVIQRVAQQHWSPFERAVSEGWKHQELPWMADLTGGEAVGYGPMPLNISGRKRMSAARAYLTSQVRARPNLTIVGEANATRLLTVNGRVGGAEFIGKAGTATIRARNVILSAGAIATPILLLRSGIGGAAELSKLGIRVVADRPGVGANLQEHATLLLAAHIRRASRRRERLPPCLSFARYSSGVAGCHDADMIATTIGAAPGATAWNPLRRAFGGILSIVHKPYSRGIVRLGAEGTPRVMLNLLSDERDLIRMIKGWEKIRGLVTTAECARHINQAFVPLTLGRTDDSIKTALTSTIAAWLLDGPAAIRKWILDSIGLPVDAVPISGEALRDWVQMFASPAAHACGTCRMGRPDDAQAVVDSNCRVIGVEGLNVVDSSIFPTLMRSGTHIPTIMAAEKIAAAMLKR
jgi:5-(hydroxymethyl)furfural/furfural oxidase